MSQIFLSFSWFSSGRNSRSWHFSTTKLQLSKIKTNKFIKTASKILVNNLFKCEMNFSVIELLLCRTLKRTIYKSENSHDSELDGKLNGIIIIIFSFF